jgi:predicted RNase H-like HicB family nuclease
VNEHISFSGWAYITRAEDVPGCWVAHCLDFNIMSAGDSPQHALEMVHEAVGLALADDLSRGLDPHARKADDDDWAPLIRLFEKHTKVPVSTMDTCGQDFREFAAPLTVVLIKQVHDGVAADAGLHNMHGCEVLAPAA